MAEKVHVLVVDDEAEVRDLLQEYLSGQDYDVSTAGEHPRPHVPSLMPRKTITRSNSSFSI